MRIVTCVIGAVVLLALFARQSPDPDFWWHLKTGEYILTQKALPVPDPFSFTTGLGGSEGEAVRYFNLTHEWLAQAAMYLAHSAGMLVWLRSALLTAMCFLVADLAFRRTGVFVWGVLAGAASATVAWWFIADRPAILTFFFVALFLWILETRRGVYLLPVLSLMWANCHGGFFLGWVILAAYWIANRRDKQLTIVTALSVLLSGLNPNFFGVIRTLFEYRSSQLQSTLTEWQRPSLWGQPYAFDILLYLAAIVLFLNRKKVKLSDWLLFAAFALASLTAFRNIILIGILAPVLIAAYFPWRMPRIPEWVAPAGLLAGFLFLAPVGIAEWAYPAGASQFLTAHPGQGNLFNTYEYGGYLIWKLGPKQKVFIDGRALNESVFSDYQKILYTPERDALLQKYGIGAIVVNGFEYNSGALYPIVLALGNPASPWKLVYEDAQALVFMKDLPQGVTELPKAQRVIDHLEAECTSHIQHDPSLPLCAATLSDLSAKAGDRARAERMAALYRAH